MTTKRLSESFEGFLRKENSKRRKDYSNGATLKLENLTSQHSKRTVCCAHVCVVHTFCHSVHIEKKRRRRGGGGTIEFQIEFPGKCSALWCDFDSGRAKSPLFPCEKSQGKCGSPVRFSVLIPKKKILFFPFHL